MSKQHVSHFQQLRNALTDEVILDMVSIRSYKMMENRFHSPMMAHAALRQGQTVWVTVKGDSMRPLIRFGDQVLIEPVDSPRLGDIVTFYETSTLCTHRVIGRVNKAGQLFLLTKGDFCGQRDQPIPVESIIGKVTAIQRSDRKLVIDGSFWRLLNITFLVFSLGNGIILQLKWKLSQAIASR